MSKATYKYGYIGPNTRETTLESLNPPGKDTRLHPEALLPPGVTPVVAGLAIRDYHRDGVEEAIVRYRQCVKDVVEEGARRTFLVGFPIAAQLGRARALRLFEETEGETGLPASSDAEATIEAMNHLGVRRVTMASRWAPELNDALCRYLADAGIEVLYSTNANQWARDAHAMSLDQGIKLSFQLGRDALRNAPQAEGLLMPGGSWRPLPAVAILEEDSGLPVFSNMTSIPWRLIHDGIAPPVEGWGKLLATP